MRFLWSGLKTFARRLGFLPEFVTAPSLAKPTAASSPVPGYLVRACDFSVSINLVREVEASTKPIEELRDLAIECFFGGKTTELSVYGTTTQDCFEPAHGLGLVARVIAAKFFDAGQRDKHERQIRSWVAKEKGAKQPAVLADKKLVSFAIPAKALRESGATLTPSPGGNLNFAPADELHFDISFSDASSVADLLLHGIRTGQIRWTCIHKEDFRGLACAALGACVARYGDLSNGEAPAEWRDGDKLLAREQVVRLRHMAGERMLKTLPSSE